MNLIYDSARAAFLSGDLDWMTDTVRVALVRGYDYSANHAHLSDVTDDGAGAIVATSAPLSAKTSTAGVAGAADITFTDVPAGGACEALILYKDTGDPSTSALIARIDSGIGLPVTPSGGDISVMWDPGANRIFKL
jgi:hypothetical protein